MYSVGDMVKVRTYYDDMIPKGIYTGLIIGIREYNFGEKLSGTIYDLLDLDTSVLKAAEQFAIIEKVGERNHERICG